MQIKAAALMACTGIVALCWATTGVAALAGSTTGTTSTPPPSSGGRALTSLPSILLLATQPALAGTCGGSAFTVNTYINVTTQSSADVKVTAPDVGTIEEFTDETGKNIGPYSAVYPTFQIPAFGGGLAPDTIITITITTYSGPNLSGSTSFVSSLQFNCTSGAVILTQPSNATGASVPALSTLGLAATAALLALVAAVLLRGAARPRRARR